MYVNSGENCHSCQASSSRLGESTRSSPWFCSSISLSQRVLVLSDALSRSGESGSPKRALEETSCGLCSHPRPGEELWFWASGGLAQASWSHPSESSQRATIAGLAQATTPSLSETVVVA